MNLIIVEKKMIEKLLVLTHSLANCINHLEELHNICESNNWLDNQDVCSLLRISPRTLQTMRDKNTIRYSQINRKIYYKSKDILQLLKQHEINNK